jgi:hypothetical protein
MLHFTAPYVRNIYDFLMRNRNRFYLTPNNIVKVNFLILYLWDKESFLFP